MSSKLAALREQMRQHQLDFYFVPSTDAHNNEYVPDAWQRRAWISEFTGSAGDALINTKDAYLWTDPRYFLQAEQQLNAADFRLMRQQQGMAPPISEWLKEHANNKTVGVDPKVISLKTATQWSKTLESIGGKLESVDNNLIDTIWADQPVIEMHPPKVLDEQYTGKSTTSKLTQLRDYLKTHQIDAHVITMLDAIAWLFNIRGQDIDFNPLVISYAFVTEDQAILFLDAEKLNAEDSAYFADNNIKIANYSDIKQTLNTFKGSVLIDPKTTSWWIAQELNQATLVHGTSPITLTKAIKNETEQNGMREAHRRDAIAMCKFLHWLEDNWQGQTEISAADYLNQCRQEDEYCQGLSFTTISGYGPHGAIIHYSVNEETNIPLNNDNLYLVDSGGQYLQGTTDITRTLHLGEPTDEQKHHYTLVLKGHLALRHTQFPTGTTGEHLNALAHHPLWQEGLDFGHGTGHGVGCYLCVHEGPQRISAGYSGVALQGGMVVSNEPGLYFPEKYGIRIENLCLIKETIPSDESPTGHGPFLGFEDLTMVPYARNLMKLDELRQQEIQWIDDYHQHIYNLLRDDLPPETHQWLRRATQSLTSNK